MSVKKTVSYSVKIDLSLMVREEDVPGSIDALTHYFCDNLPDQCAVHLLAMGTVKNLWLYFAFDDLVERDIAYGELRLLDRQIDHITPDLEIVTIPVAGKTVSEFDFPV